MNANYDEFHYLLQNSLGIGMIVFSTNNFSEENTQCVLETRHPQFTLERYTYIIKEHISWNDGWWTQHLQTTDDNFLPFPTHSFGWLRRRDGDVHLFSLVYFLQHDKLRLMNLFDPLLRWSFLLYIRTSESKLDLRSKVLLSVLLWKIFWFGLLWNFILFL